MNRDEFRNKQPNHPSLTPVWKELKLDNEALLEEYKELPEDMLPYLRHLLQLNEQMKNITDFRTGRLDGSRSAAQEGEGGSLVNYLGLMAVSLYSQVVLQLQTVRTRHYDDMVVHYPQPPMIKTVFHDRLGALGVFYRPHEPHHGVPAPEFHSRLKNYSTAEGDGLHLGDPLPFTELPQSCLGELFLVLDQYVAALAAKHRGYFWFQKDDPGYYHRHQGLPYGSVDLLSFWHYYGIPVNVNLMRQLSETDDFLYNQLIRQEAIVFYQAIVNAIFYHYFKQVGIKRPVPFPQNKVWMTPPYYKILTSHLAAYVFVLPNSHTKVGHLAPYLYTVDQDELYFFYTNFDQVKGEYLFLQPEAAWFTDYLYQQVVKPLRDLPYQSIEIEWHHQPVQSKDGPTPFKFYYDKEHTFSFTGLMTPGVSLDNVALPVHRLVVPSLTMSREIAHSPVFFKRTMLKHLSQSAFFRFPMNIPLTIRLVK